MERVPSSLSGLFTHPPKSSQNPAIGRSVLELISLANASSTFRWLSTWLVLVAFALTGRAYPSPRGRGEAACQLCVVFGLVQAPTALSSPRSSEATCRCYPLILPREPAAHWIEAVRSRRHTSPTFVGLLLRISRQGQQVVEERKRVNTRLMKLSRVYGNAQLTLRRERKPVKTSHESHKLCVA